jgi:hypothetical protein
VVGKADRPLLVTTHQCIPVTKAHRDEAKTFCAGNTIQLFSVVFCVVRAVHKLTNGEQWQEGLRMLEAHVSTGSMCFPRPPSPALWDSIHVVQVNSTLLGNGR